MKLYKLKLKQGVWQHTSTTKSLVASDTIFHALMHNAGVTNCVEKLKSIADDTYISSLFPMVNDKPIVPIGGAWHELDTENMKPGKKVSVSIRSFVKSQVSISRLEEAGVPHYGGIRVPFYGSSTKAVPVFDCYLLVSSPDPNLLDFLINVTSDEGFGGRRVHGYGAYQVIDVVEVPEPKIKNKSLLLSTIVPKKLHGAALIDREGYTDEFWRRYNGSSSPPTRVKRNIYSAIEGTILKEKEVFCGENIIYDDMIHYGKGIAIERGDPNG